MTHPSSADPAAQAVRTLVTYLEMRARPQRAPTPAPCPGLEVRHAHAPTVSFYRYLYEAVGASWIWTERTLMDHASLAAIVQAPEVEVHVLWRDGVPAGYVELDQGTPDETKITYFGLMPEFIGRGLGRFLLDWAIFHAWRRDLQRLWLHTCDLDHPRALPLYQGAGFQVYDRRYEIVRLVPGSAA